MDLDQDQQYTAMLVKDGDFRRLFVFDSSGNLVTGILNYDLPKFHSVVPAALFVLKLGASFLKCHEELLGGMEPPRPNASYDGCVLLRNQYIQGYLETLWLMLPEDVQVDETHHFRISEWAGTWNRQLPGLPGRLPLEDGA